MLMIDPAAIEKLVPNIKILEQLPKGGQKLVFRAKHDQYGAVVFKIVFDASSDERVKREIEIATTCNFSNVPKLHESGYIQFDTGQVMFLIEEYIPGFSLRQFLKDKGKLSLRMGLDLLESLLITATELENFRLVHRDIKPENIMVREGGGFSLLDFGIARKLDGPSLTFTRAHFGPHSPGYSAPEQFRNLKKEIDIRADLFSIGVVTYEALSGKHPFISPGIHPLDVLQRTETITPSHFSIQGDSQKQLMGFISILMDKFSSRRPNSARVALEWYYALLPTVMIEEAM